MKNKKLTPKKKGKRGGWRPGSGAKSLYGDPMVRITVRITPAQLTYLDSTYVTHSAGLRSLIEKDMKHAN